MKYFVNLPAVILLLITVALSIFAYYYFISIFGKVSSEGEEEVEETLFIKVSTVLSCNVINVNGNLGIRLVMRGNYNVSGNWNFILKEYWREQILDTKVDYLNVNEDEVVNEIVVFDYPYEKNYFILEIIPPEGSKMKEVCKP